MIHALVRGNIHVQCSSWDGTVILSKCYGFSQRAKINRDNPSLLVWYWANICDYASLEGRGVAYIMLFKILDSALWEAIGFPHRASTQERKNNWLQQKKRSAGGNSFWRDSDIGASRQVDNKWNWHIFPQVWPLDKQLLCSSEVVIPVWQGKLVGLLRGEVSLL